MDLAALRGFGIRRRGLRCRLLQPEDSGQSVSAVRRRRPVSEHRPQHAEQRAFHPDCAANRGVRRTARAAGDVHAAAVPVRRIIRVSGACGFLCASDRRCQRGHAGTAGIPVCRVWTGGGVYGAGGAKAGIEWAGFVPSTNSGTEGGG